MDSPFNQGFRRDQSPASPQTPGGSNAYQVNVNRTKTRKWVEAKVQNYDGDDWGADEYDEDDEPEPEPTPPVPPAKHDAALPSTQPAHDAAVPSTTGHLPALQTQPAAAAAVPSIQQTRPAGVTSPVVSDPSTLGSPVDRDRVVSPQSTIAAASIASNSQPPEAALPLAEKTSVVQSFDVHAPLVEAKTEEPTPADAGHSAEAHPSDRNRPDGTSVESQTKDGVGAAEHGEDDRRRFSVSPKLPDVGRMSAFGTDLFSPGESGFLAEPTVTEPEKDNDVSSLASPTCLAQYDAEPTKAAVPASPPVPETTPTILAEPVQAPVEQQPVTVSEDSAGGKSPVASVERHSSAKSAAGSATKASVDETAAHSVSQVGTESTDGPGISPVSEPGEEPRSAIGSLISHPPELRPEGGLAAIPPLRTPSPREPSSEKFQELPTVVAPTTLGNAQPDAEFDGNPLLRQSTLSTVNESPVKDNDALSEEILRSLSPTRSGPADAALGDSSKLQPGDRSAARESSYTLQDYDSYWADTSKPEPIPEREPPAEAGSSVPGNTTSPTAPPEAAKAEVQATSPREPELRRKFSWEAEEAVPPPASAPAAEATRSPVATTAGAGDEMSAAEVSRTQEAPPGLIPISAQQPAAVEPPSPVSTSDEPLRHSKRVSLMDDNALAETAPTPPPESHPPTADVAATPYSAPPQQQAQVMPFREIMGLSSSADRINKYNESRDYFVTSDSGLDSWLVTLKDQHPEYANGAVPYGAAPAGRQPTPGSSNASPVGTQPPSQQQPYYQQYLNASSPTAGPSPTSRSRLGGLQMPSSQGSGSAFGHSGNQIGTKSKEFMHSAGKMGKGLLSKGKSKLRASGDKDEASPAAAPAPAAGEQQPPPPQPKPKGEKRMSWGLGLAARSRPDGTAPPADSGPDSGSNTGSHTDNASTVAPQIPQPTPMSPLSSSSHQPGPTPPWGAAGPGQPPSQPPPSMGHGQHHPVQSPRPGGPGSRATAGLSKLEIPGGVQPTTGASARGWPVGGGQSAAAKPTQPEQLAAEGRASDDWVIVPRDSGDHPIGFAALQDATVTAPPVARPIPQDSGVALQSEPPANDPGPQRKSSFIGLPPIRRTSTFGLTTKAKRASERFSLDDDDDDDAQAAAGVGGVPPAGHPVDLDKSLPPAPIDQEAAPAGASPQVRTRVSAADGEAADGTGTQRTQGTDTQRTLVDTNATGPQAQKDDAQLQEPHAPHSAPRQASQQTMAPPKSPMMTKAQQMFPQGNWSLEESHLAEPLHERTRNRSGTGGSQHTPAFGFDKETGVMMPPQRQRTSDVPPSSAQRWPELFQRRPDYDAQRPRANSGAGRPYPQQYQHQMVRGEAVNPRPQISEFAIAGVGPPAEEEDRGRSKRNSGIFRGIGDRISRTASKERRPSLAAQPQSSEVRGDEVSENSVATSELQEPKKRRPSFMFGRSGRTSMDQSSLRNESINGPDHVGMRGPDTPPPQAERRRSLFGMGAGGKAAVPAPGQSPTSSVANDSSSAIAANTEEAAPKKKRFSNLAKVGGIKDIFHRPGNNDKAKESNAEGPTPGSHPHGPGAMAPPPAPFHGRARSSTANSHDLPLPQPVVAQEGLEGRGRRGSASNLFAAFTGRGSASKTRQQGDAPGHNQPVLHQQPVHRMASPPAPHGSHLQAQPGMLAHGAPPRPQVRASLDSSRPGQPAGHFLHGQQPRPSPLGQASPVVREGTPTAARAPDPVQTAKPASTHSRKPSTPQMSQRDVVSPETDRHAPLAGIGAQHDADAELLRTATVSPNLSITSDGKAEQTRSEAGKDETPQQAPGAPGSETSRASPGPRQDNPGTATSTPRGRVSRELTPLGIVNGQRTPSGVTGPHARNASGDLAAGGPQRDSASPTPMQTPPSGPLRNQQPHSPPRQEQPAIGLGLRPHPHQMQSPQGQPQRMHPQQMQSQQMRPQQMPSQYMHPQQMHPQQMYPQGATAQGGRPQYPTQPHPAPAGDRLPAPPSQQDHSSHGTSRWKGLKNRVSGQMAHSGPQHHQKQEKGEKGDRLSGSKLLGAFKRGSKQPDPGHQAGPQSQQPNVPAQPGQFQQRPAQAQPMGAPARSPAQPGVANVSGPQQVPQQRHVSMPAQQLPQQPVQQQPVQQRHSAPQQEPVYDQVPIPQGYSTVRGEGTVAPSPYNIPRHMAQGQFHQLQPQVSPRQGQPQQSPPAAQAGFPRRASAQSPEMGSSPGLGSSPSPPSTVDRRGSAGISDVLAHQPSANSIAPNHTRADDAATKSQQGYLQPNAGGHNPSGPRSHSSDGSHVSADEATVSQQSRSPEPSVTDKSVSRNNNLGIDVDKAKKLTEDNIYDATPRLNNNSGGGSHKQRPAKLSRAVSGETIDSQGEVKEHAVVVHDGDDGDNEGPTAELDDTADRYERSRRLESQEEKILYKPEDQEDFLPQMSATSYPGQEWNPYGEPGFGEWKDE